MPIRAANPGRKEINMTSYKKHSAYKGWIIGIAGTDNYACFTKDEWSFGNGLRTPDWETDSLHEIKLFIDCY